MASPTQTDVIIIGGGAAGLMCAIEAGKRGRKVIVLERSERLGKKILISGGGRCNFTNLYAGPENYISGNEHFCKSALARFTPADFMAMLEKESATAGVEIRLNSDIQCVEKNDLFAIRCNDDLIRSNSLVIATGGLSYSKIGATGVGYQIANQFGIGLIPPRPGLVPLLF